MRVGGRQVDAPCEGVNNSVSRSELRLPTKSELVVSELISRIRSGQWTPGTRLPSERDLAGELHVSRTAVREALKVLQLSGEISTRQGEGSYVRHGVRRGEEAERAVVGAGESIIRSLEGREALEIAAAVLAVTNASPADRLHIQASRLELEEAVAAGEYQRYVLATFNLHEIIARASRNSFLEQQTHLMLQPMRRNVWALTDIYDPEVARYSRDLHYDLIDALLDGDVEALVRAVRQHYEAYPAIEIREGDPPAGWDHAGMDTDL